jgi:NADH-quinone oxidoreductase subunit C
MSENNEKKEGEAPPEAGKAKESPAQDDKAAPKTPSEAKPAAEGAKGAKPVPPKAAAGAARPARPAPRPNPAEEALRAEVPSVPLDRLREVLPAAIEEVTFFAGVPIVRVRRGDISKVGRFLRDDPASDMKYLSNLCGAHYPGRSEPFEVVYHLYSITKNHRMELKVRSAEGEPVPTVEGVWRTANWHEREAFDMYGIPFEGHPDLTRILLPDDWEGHPLRKDYPLEGKPGDHKSYRRE